MFPLIETLKSVVKCWNCDGLRTCRNSQVLIYVCVGRVFISSGHKTWRAITGRSYCCQYLIRNSVAVTSWKKVIAELAVSWDSILRNARINKGIVGICTFIWLFDFINFNKTACLVYR